MKLLKHPFVLVLWLVTLVDSFVHNCYFNWTGMFLGTATEAGGVGIPGNWIMPVMSVGQIAEILTMFILGATLKKLGWRTTMIFGILGHAARFAVYAFFPQHKELIIVVQVLHGICYAFFFATVYIFVDAYFPEGRPRQRAGLVQRDDPRHRRVAGQFHLPVPDPESFHARRHDEFPRPVPRADGVSLAAAVALALFFHPPKDGPAEGGSSPAH